VDPVTELENALGAELLRSTLLRAAKPKLGSRYIVEDVLGRGASGLVVAALDDRLNRPVALKVRPVEGDSAMLAEARALARLDHPNVVRVHDVEVVTTRLDGREFKLWLVSMARLEGRTMRAWLREQQRTVPEILAVLVDVGRGLAAAHAQRIVHRDVKPDNIIVRADGAAQVVDFGLAVQSASTQSELGGMRPTAGTDPYISPEARVGRTTRKSDQFSLGVTLVEALTGTPVPAGRRAPPGVSSATWAVARRATEPEPDERFESMSALVDEMVRAARAPASSRVWPSVIGVAAVSALLGVGVAWTTDEAATSGQNNSVDESPSDAGLLDDAPEPRAADAWTPPIDADTHDAAVMPHDANARDARADDATSTASAVTTTSLVTSASAGACGLRSRSYAFQTRWTQGDRPDVLEGRYELGVDLRRDRPVDLRLTQVEPSRDRHWIRDRDLSEGCALHLVTTGRRLRYEFWLEFDGAAVTGRFEATGAMTFSGVVGG
jgi:hypothetical protein